MNDQSAHSVLASYVTLGHASGNEELVEYDVSTYYYYYSVIYRTKKQNTSQYLK